MSRSKVSFVLSTQDIGQAAAGNDFISGLVLYGTAPGSFATNAYQPVYSVADAESKGITLDYSDETPAKAIVTISGSPTAGDTLNLKVTETNPVTPDNPLGTTIVDLGTGTAPATPTVTTYAAAVVAAINAGTYLHGYTATNSAGVITITARQGLGINLNPAVNATPLAITGTGTSTYAITQQFGTGSGGATVGVYSKKAVWHYQVSEFFRANSTGVLWVGFFSSVDMDNDCVTLGNAAGGVIKQFGVYDFTATSASTLSSNGTKLQAQMVTLFNGYNPAIVLYAPNIKAISDLSTLENQQNKTNYYVSPVILQDGGALGAQLFINSGVSITAIGCTLGTVSKAKVNQDIGEIGAFNITDDTELAIPAFANGQLVSALSSNLLDQLDAYRYIFATKMPNITGTYFVNDWSAIVQTSPYYRISRNRVMNKAIRLIYQGIVPLLKSQITLNTDGTISDVTLATFDSAVIPTGTQMKNAGEISNLKVTINSSQNIISEGKLVVGVAIQPTITADFIEVDMAFVAKI